MSVAPCVLHSNHAATASGACHAAPGANREPVEGRPGLPVPRQVQCARKKWADPAGAELTYSASVPVINRAAHPRRPEPPPDAPPRGRRQPAAQPQHPGSSSHDSRPGGGDSTARHGEAATENGRAEEEPAVRAHGTRGHPASALLPLGRGTRQVPLPSTGSLSLGGRSLVLVNARGNGEQILYCASIWIYSCPWGVFRIRNRKERSQRSNAPFIWNCIIYGSAPICCFSNSTIGSNGTEARSIPSPRRRGIIFWLRSGDSCARRGDQEPNEAICFGHYPVMPLP